MHAGTTKEVCLPACVVYIFPFLEVLRTLLYN